MLKAMVQSACTAIQDLLLVYSVTLTTLWANSADDKMTISFLFFLENRISHFIEMHEMSKPGFLKNKKKIFKLSSAEILSRVLKS